jgi:hypothetical protein
MSTTMPALRRRGEQSSGSMFLLCVVLSLASVCLGCLGCRYLDRRSDPRPQLDNCGLNGISPEEQLEMLASAVASDNERFVACALDKGTPVDQRLAGTLYYPYNMTLLMLASQVGALHVGQLLLARGADPDIRDKRGMTALMYAVGSQQEASVRKLIHMGADVNARTSPEIHGQTALSIALSLGRNDFADLLRRAGAR